MATKTALITGGSRGIGFGIAEHLARNGYDLAINGIRDEKEVTDRLKSLSSFGVKVVYCPGNIGNEEHRNAIVKKSIGELGAINVLVNNAGVAPRVRKDVLELDPADYDYVMDINLKGTFFLSQAVALHMIDRKRKDNYFQGCIISITSISAEVASVNRGEYCMAKAGLGMMTKLLATRLGEVDIPVYEVRPGIIETDMTAGVKEKYDKLISEGLTIEKRWGKPEDIGKIVAALAGGELPYATGQIIYADGGMSVRRL
ncbi:MAG TPA: 3-ketoacyl-ACP reductase [Cyclobacteriaceae bacterium]|nr:3-ketoacyl-ACP reductase [Cyclobacteriaceae bacterium]